MPENRINELLTRLEVAAKLAGLLKWIILGIFGAGGWLTALQIQVQSNKDRIAAVEMDRKERIHSSDEWHRQKDRDDATRDATLKTVVEMLKHQQDQFDSLFRPTRP